MKGLRFRLFNTQPGPERRRDRGETGEIRNWVDNTDRDRRRWYMQTHRDWSVGLTVSA